MASATRLSVRDYTNLMRALMLADRESRLFVRHAFRDVGEIVRQRAASRFARYDARTSAGFKVRVRQRGIAVEQSIGKSTGRRGDFGALQMTRALIPARSESYDDLENAIEDAFDRVADHFNGLGG